MTHYQVTFAVALVLTDDDEHPGRLPRIDAGELCEAIDDELPTTLWVTTRNGVECGYIVRTSEVAVLVAPKRIPEHEVQA